MKVFVTGATGFVGSFLAELLVNRNYQVKTLVRKSSNLKWIADLDVECVYGDLSDKEFLKKAISDCDYVYHVAGVTKARTESEYFKGNYDGTVNIVDAAVEGNPGVKRFLFVSSQAAIGPSPTFIPIDENVDPNPLTWYGNSKLAAEKYVEENKNKIPVTIVRPPAVYGPRDADVLEFFRAVNKGIIPQLGGKDKYVSLVNVHDLARGIFMAAESKNTVGEAYFVANPEPISWSEFSRLTLEILGKKGITVPVPLLVMKGLAYLYEGYSSLTGKNTIVNQQKIIEMEQDFWTCSPRKAKKDFGYESKITLSEGIGEVLAWYKQNNWL